ncbi:MAG: DUF2059 domain-containing protein [Polyangiaceae bacterium]
MPDLSPLGLVAAFLGFLTVGCGGSAPPLKEPATTSTSASPAQDDGLDAMTDEQLVRKLLEATGAAALGKQVGDSMIDTFRKMPNLPPGFLDRFKQNLHVDELTELIVPIYLKHYDHQTLIAAIRFYRSDAGRKIVEQLPVITAESMEAGKKWGANLAKKTLRDLGQPTD